MFNLLQAELFRYFKSTAFKVMLIITAAISAFIMFANKMAMILMESSDITNLADAVISTSSSGTFILISVSFIALFCNADMKFGAIKNTASRVQKKEYLALTKFIIMTLLYIIIFLEWIVVSLIVGKIFLGSYLTLSISSAQAGAIAMQFLFHVAYGSIIMMLAVLAKNTAVPITIGLVLSMGITSLIYMLIDLIRKKLSHCSELKFESSNISLMCTMQSIDESTVTQEGLRMFIVGAVYLAIGLFVSMLIYKKRDI